MRMPRLIWIFAGRTRFCRALAQFIWFNCWSTGELWNPYANRTLLHNWNNNRMQNKSWALVKPGLRLTPATHPANPPPRPHTYYPHPNNSLTVQCFNSVFLLQFLIGLFVLFSLTLCMLCKTFSRRHFDVFFFFFCFVFSFFQKTGFDISCLHEMSIPIFCKQKKKKKKKKIKKKKK